MIANLTRSARYYLIKKLSPSIWEKSQNQTQYDWISAYPRQSILFAKNYFSDKKVVCAEIGVAAGNNSKTILSLLNVEKMYLIDPYVEYMVFESGAERMFSAKLQEERLAEAKEKLSKWKDLCIWVKEKSEDAIKQFVGNSLDFVYIDGIHTYEYVWNDLLNFYPKVKSGGILSGHDFTSECIGCVSAVIDFFRTIENSELYAKCADWWVVKG